MQDWTHLLTDLVDRRGGALVRYAALLCGDATEAEDLVQESLVRCFASSRGRHLEIDEVESYVRRAILNLYLDSYRRRQRWQAVRHLLRPGETTHEPDVDIRADLDAALQSLPPRQRACMVLRYFADLPLATVAAELGVTVGTVKRHLHEATARLGALIEHPQAEGERA